MEHEFVATGGLKARGDGDSSLVHASDTWQTWAFLFTAIVVLLFSVIDAFDIPFLSHWTGRFAIFGMKVVSFIGAFWLVMLNRTVRQWLIGIFERYVRTEGLG